MLEPIWFVVHTADGEDVKGRIELPDQIAIERQYDCSVAQVFVTHTAERLAFGAWNYLRRHSQTDLDFDPWFETVESMRDSAHDESVDESADINPKEDASATEAPSEA